MAEPKLSPRAKRFVAAGQLLYGDDYRTRFADVVGISKQLAAFIAKGERPVSDDVDAKISVAIASEIERLGGVIKKLEEIERKHVSKNKEK
jgi:hypothetical protein